MLLMKQKGVMTQPMAYAALASHGQVGVKVSGTLSSAGGAFQTWDGGLCALRWLRPFLTCVQNPSRATSWPWPGLGFGFGLVWFGFSLSPKRWKRLVS